MGTEPQHEDPEPVGGETNDRVNERALLLPEERAVGSDDPEAQAAAILDDSDHRTDDPEGTRREYSQTPDPEE